MAAYSYLVIGHVSTSGAYEPTINRYPGGRILSHPEFSAIRPIHYAL